MYCPSQLLKKDLPFKIFPRRMLPMDDIIEKIIRPGLSLDPNSVAGLENGQET